MRAITVRQPWATLIAEGTKRYETRSWSTRYRGPLAIHAGGSIRSDEQRLANELWERGILLAPSRALPRGTVIATTTIMAVVHVHDAQPSDLERELGDFTGDRYAWLLSEPSLVDLTGDGPPKIRGALGLWHWNP